MKREHSYIIGALALAGAILLAEADTVKNGFVEVVGEGARANGDRDVVLHEPEDPSEVKVSTQAGWRFTDPRNAAFQHHVGATDLIHLVNESKESEATIKITDDWEHTCEKTNWEEHVSAPKLVVGGADHALILLKPDDVGVFLETNFTASAGEDGIHNAWTKCKPCRHPDCRGRNPLKWVDEKKIHAPDQVEGEIRASGKILVDPDRTEGYYLLEGPHELSYVASFALEECEEHLCVGGAVTNTTWDVCRLSVTNTPYLGIDLTDEGKKTNAVGIAEARYGYRPKNTAASYTWEFESPRHGVIASQDDEKGTARLESARPAEPSDSYRGDKVVCHAELTETNPPEGHTPCVARATATNAVTVVRVDVCIAGVDEDKEETEGAFVQFVPDTNGVISVEGTNAMKKTTVAFSCTPALPPGELVEVSCSGKGELYEKLLDETLSLVTTNLYSACDISNRTFMLHGHNVSGALRDGSIKIKHVKSGAVDIAKYTNFDIKLVTPAGDPVKEPVDTGDGQNEFTYSSSNPGLLTIKLKATISPTGLAESLKKDCKFLVSSIETSVMAWDQTNPGGGPIVDGDNLIATVVFTGLPEKNSDFGRKKASISYCGEVWASADYEVFFPAKGANHPPCKCADDCARCPNWFYYWREGKVCSIPENAVYSTGGYDERVMFDGQTDFDNNRVIVGRDARSNNYSNQVTGVIFKESLINGLPTVLMTNVVTYVGVNAAGVRAVAASVKHEKRHFEIKDEYVAAPDYRPYITIEMDGETFQDGGCPQSDTDGDSVVDSSELSARWGLETMVGSKDTYFMSQFSSVYSTYGDNEVLSRWAEAIDLEDGISYYTRLDWANPGCQSKSICGPYPNSAK